MSPSGSASSGWIGVTGARPVLRSAYTGALAIGPGRYSAFTAEMSPNLSARMARSSARIGPPSIWNTPSVSPRANSS